MTLTKIVLFIAMLTMGALNHRALHGRLGTGSWLASGAGAASDLPPSGSLVFRRRLEVEAGFVAARPAGRDFRRAFDAEVARLEVFLGSPLPLRERSPRSGG